MSGIKKAAKIALPIAAIAAPFAAPALLGGMAATAAGTNAAIAGMGAGVFGPATASAVAGAGGFGMVGTALAGAGGFMSTANSILGGVQTVAGALSGATSTYMGARSNAFAAKQGAEDMLARAENYDFQAGISDINSAIAERNRVFEEQSNFAAEQMLIRRNKVAIGQAKALYSTAGVTLSGSALDAIAASAAEGDLSVALQKFESSHRQWGMEQQRNVAEMEAGEFRKAAERSRKNASSILEEAKKAEKQETSVSFVQGLGAIPDVISGFEQLTSIFD